MPHRCACLHACQVSTPLRALRSPTNRPPSTPRPTPERKCTTRLRPCECTAVRGAKFLASVFDRRALLQTRAPRSRFQGTRRQLRWTATVRHRGRFRSVVRRRSDRSFPSDRKATRCHTPIRRRSRDRSFGQWKPTWHRKLPRSAAPR